MRIWIDALRIRQWPKNLLVFVPLVFAFRLSEPKDIVTEIALFAVFCLLSSAVYLANDIHDRERDREHPLKKARPVASGALTVGAAAGAGAMLFVAGTLLSFAALPGHARAVVFSYIFLQVLYNAFLREHAGADVIVIALGFVLRALAGAVAIGVIFSEWLLICTFFGAARIALGKRQAELIAGRTGLRRGWEDISDGMLRSAGVMTNAVLLMAYTFYCFNSATAGRVGRLEGILATIPPLFLSLPIAYFGVLRYEFLAARGLAGEPEFILTRDPQLFIAILGWLAVSFAALYIWRAA